MKINLDGDNMLTEDLKIVIVHLLARVDAYYNIMAPGDAW
jgi:hypothetical protein